MEGIIHQDSHVEIDTRKIQVEVKKQIDKHFFDCIENNRLRFMSKTIFNWSMIALALTVISGIAAYLNAEAGQNQKLIIIERQFESTGNASIAQYSDIIQRLETIQKDVKR